MNGSASSKPTRTARPDTRQQIAPLPDGGQSTGSGRQRRIRFVLSAPDRLLYFGKQLVEPGHAPRWQSAAPDRTTGVFGRTLARLGKDKVEESRAAALPKLRWAVILSAVRQSSVTDPWLARMPDD